MLTLLAILHWGRDLLFTLLWLSSPDFPIREEMLSFFQDSFMSLGAYHPGCHLALCLLDCEAYGEYPQELILLFTQLTLLL